MVGRSSGGPASRGWVCKKAKVFAVTRRGGGHVPGWAGGVEKRWNPWRPSSGGAGVWCGFIGFRDGGGSPWPGRDVARRLVGVCPVFNAPRRIRGLGRPARPGVSPTGPREQPGGEVDRGKQDRIARPGTVGAQPGGRGWPERARGQGFGEPARGGNPGPAPVMPAGGPAPGEGCCGHRADLPRDRPAFLFRCPRFGPLPAAGRFAGPAAVPDGGAWPALAVILFRGDGGGGGPPAIIGPDCGLLALPVGGGGPGRCRFRAGAGRKGGLCPRGNQGSRKKRTGAAQRVVNPSPSQARAPSRKLGPG